MKRSGPDDDTFAFYTGGPADHSFQFNHDAAATRDSWHYVSKRQTSMRPFDSYSRIIRYIPYGCLLLVSSAYGNDPPEIVALVQKHLSPRTIRTKVDAQGAKRIYHLGLPNDRDALEILPHLDKLKYLTSLYLGYDGLTDKDLKKLPSLPNLRELRIGGDRITDEGLKALSGMRELRRLSLDHTQVRGAGLAHLKQSTKLEWLDLGSTPLDDSAIPHIVKHFKRLKRFDFPETNVTPEGLIKLADLHWLTNVGPPDNIAGPTDDPKALMKARRALFREYVIAYKESKRKARAAGEDVPPDHVGPFGLIE